MQADKYIQGYVVIFVEGYFTEKFINLALKNNILMWNVENNSSGFFTACIKAKEYKKLKEIAKKTKCRMKIQKKIGVPFTMHKYKKRKIFLAFLALIIIGIIAYSSFIWEVEIVGKFNIPINELKEQLEDENIKIGMKKSNLDTDKIKLNMALKRNDLAWIGINIKGTKATVEIVEKTMQNEIKDNEPCDIISDKSGIVTKTNTRMGTCIVKEGDFVNKGQVLISGVMSSQFSEDRYVHSDGEVYIKTWYTEKVNLPYERDLVNLTENEENKYKLEIFGIQINLSNSSTKYKKYDKIENVNRFRILERFSLPILVTKTTYKEVAVDTIKYTPTQAENIAKNMAMNRIKEIIPNDSEIIDNNINVIVGESSVQVEINAQCIEIAGIKQKMGV